MRTRCSPGATSRYVSTATSFVHETRLNWDRLAWRSAKENKYCPCNWARVAFIGSPANHVGRKINHARIRCGPAANTSFTCLPMSNIVHTHFLGINLSCIRRICASFRKSFCSLDFKFLYSSHSKQVENDIRETVWFRQFSRTRIL